MAAETFIVTGARRSAAEFSMDNLAESYQAVLCEVDFERGVVLRSYVEDKPDPAISVQAYSASFRGCSRYGNTLYSCTHSEIVEFEIDNFTVKNRITLPVFNDLHHVMRSENGLIFASTGIDHVGMIEAAQTRLYPVLPQGDYAEVDPRADYRVICTKPHKAHPNHVFRIDGQLWVTRFEQRDAVRLDNFDERLAVEVERPHDGLVVDNRVYFTTVNGAIVVFDAKSRRRLEVHDLTQLQRNPKMGWCRGIEVVGDCAYVGFSTIRKTRSMDNLSFLTDRFMQWRDGLLNAAPARIMKYDLRRRKIVSEMRFRHSELGIMFSILRS